MSKTEVQQSFYRNAQYHLDLEEAVDLVIEKMESKIYSSFDKDKRAIRRLTIYLFNRFLDKTL